MLEMLEPQVPAAELATRRAALVQRDLHAALSMSGQAFVRHTSPNDL
jgi:hypothetical protein